jgi:hypothetical protein
MAGAKPQPRQSAATTRVPTRGPLFMEFSIENSARGGRRADSSDERSERLYAAAMGFLQGLFMPPFRPSLIAAIRPLHR